MFGGCIAILFNTSLSNVITPFIPRKYFKTLCNGRKKKNHVWATPSLPRTTPQVFSGQPWGEMEMFGYLTWTIVTSCTVTLANVWRLVWRQWIVTRRCASLQDPDHWQVRWLTPRIRTHTIHVLHPLQCRWWLSGQKLTLQIWLDNILIQNWGH